MRTLASALLALVCVLTVVAGAQGRQQRIPWLTFNEAGLDGKHRVLSQHDVFPYVWSLSPRHDRYAYVSYTCDGCPYSQRLMLADVRRSKDRLLVEASQGIREVAWAPNGRTIAFVSGAVWLIDADGMNLRRVADSAAMLSWSPDSTRLALGRLNGELEWVISVLSIETGAEHVLGPGFRPRWSPDGKRIVFEYATGRNESLKIRLVPAAGGSPRTIARGSSPSWSPDGTRIAFARYDRYGPSASLWIVSRRGGKPRRIASSRGDGAETVVWSPDSRRLALQQGGHYCGSTLSVVRVDGGGRKRLVSQTRILTPLAWTSGGRKILYAGERCSDQ
jgi:Tol biopolymer transport system component